MFPWFGGVNTTLDPSAIEPNECVQLSGIVSVSGKQSPRNVRDGINFNWDSGSAGSVTIVSGLDFWFGSVPRTNYKVGMGSDGTLRYWTTSGTVASASLDATATAWGSSVTTGSFEVLNNQLLIGVDGSGNMPRKWAGSGNILDLGCVLFTGATALGSATLTLTTTPTVNIGMSVNSFSLTTTGNTHSNTTLDNLASTTGVTVGMSVSDVSNTYIPTGTYVVAPITSTSVTLSQAATGTHSSDAITFTNGIPASTYVMAYNNATMTVTLMNASNTSVNANGTTLGLVYQFRSPNVPAAQFFRQYLGRIWSNDKNNPDNLNYTTTGNQDEWGGIGDSGAIPIAVGDGDPLGINGIFPSFQGGLYVAKLGKLYFIGGNTPESFSVQLVSGGIGVVSHNSIAPVDQDDMIFVSQKGVHSLVGTVNQGDIPEDYLSYPIQKTFNNNWVKSRQPYIWAAYLSNINSVAIAVTDTSDSSTVNNTLWLFNVADQTWYSWNAIPCASLFVANDSDLRRFYLGGTNTRLAKTFNNTNYDIQSNNTQTTIPLSLMTGLIYLEKNPLIVNGFKKFTLIYAPSGTHSLNCSIKIDNYSPQLLNFSLNQATGILGSNFYLGQSTLGFVSVTAPYTQQLDGYGRAFQLTITQNIQGAAIQLQGFAIEYEPMGPAQETILSG
jgi:hypothetical protein